MLQTSSVQTGLEIVSVLDEVLRELADEAEMAVSSEYASGERPTHLLLSATGQALPETRAPRSVFDLSDLDGFSWLMDGRARLQSLNRPPTIQEQTHTVITREIGVTRCKRLHHTETREWQEQETARRARQIVPRPPKQSFKLSKKAKGLHDDGPAPA
jgi:hypothetical protein